MSPWRMSALSIPALARLARASASISRDWSTPIACSTLGASTSSSRPVPVPMSSSRRAPTGRWWAGARSISRSATCRARSSSQRWALSRKKRTAAVWRALLQGIESGAVGGDAGMLGIEPAHELAHQGRIVARGHEAKAGELRFAEALEQARLDQELQMA